MQGSVLDLPLFNQLNLLLLYNFLLGDIAFDFLLLPNEIFIFKHYFLSLFGPQIICWLQEPGLEVSNDIWVALRIDNWDFNPFAKETRAQLKSQVQVVPIVLSTAEDSQQEMTLSQAFIVGVLREVNSCNQYEDVH